MSNPPPAGKLYSYYRSAGISPTFGALQSEAELERFCGQRAELFTRKLQLPLEVFRESRVLEFGPDTGENALAFASWGARVELAEPNTSAWPQLQAYFERFGLTDRLIGLHDKPIQEFEPATPADIVVAEGFIHTVKPEHEWMRVVRKAVRPGGYLVLFYYERRALLMEAFHAALYRRYCTLTSESGPDTARELYGVKWDAIAHVRRFNSWVMDVLENPYTRLQFTLDATGLVNAMARSGFELYQSWPRYRDDLRMMWHKTPESASSVATEVVEHLRRSALSHALGRTLYCIGDDSSVAEAASHVDDLLQKIDLALDAADQDAWLAIADGFMGLRNFVNSGDRTYAHSTGVREAINDMLESTAHCATLAASGDAAALSDFTNDNRPFISFWGQPAHYSVFRRSASSAQ